MLEDNNAHEERKMRLVFLGFTHPATILRFDFFPRWSRPWTRSCDPRRSYQKKSRMVSFRPWIGQALYGTGKAAGKERKKERKESSTRVWLGLRLLATQTARWPTAAFLRCNRPEQNIRRHFFRRYPILRSLHSYQVEKIKTEANSNVYPRLKKSRLDKLNEINMNFISRDSVIKKNTISSSQFIVPFFHRHERIFTRI